MNTKTKENFQICISAPLKSAEENDKCCVRKIRTLNKGGFIYHLKKCNYLKRNPANIYLFKVIIETLEKGMKYVQSWQKHQIDVIDV